MHDMTEDVTITTNIRQTRCRQIGLPALDDRQLGLNCLLEASSTVDQEIFLSLIERKLMMMLMGVDETQC